MTSLSPLMSRVVEDEPLPPPPSPPQYNRDDHFPVSSPTISPPQYNRDDHFPVGSTAFFPPQYNKNDCFPLSTPVISNRNNNRDHVPLNVMVISPPRYNRRTILAWSRTDHFAAAAVHPFIKFLCKAALDLHVHVPSVVLTHTCMQLSCSSLSRMPGDCRVCRGYRAASVATTSSARRHARRRRLPASH